MKPHTLLSILSLLLPFHVGGTTLIGSNTLNGDFETGLVLPWRGITVLQSQSFAQSGSWYAVSAGSTRRSLGITLSPNKSDGAELFLSFYGRIADGSETPSLSAVFTGTGSSTREIISAPLLVSSEWRQFEYAFHLGTSWNYSSYQELYILIPDNIVSTVFIDNVQLTQVPEPSAAMLISVGVLSMVFMRRISNKSAPASHCRRSRYVRN